MELPSSRNLHNNDAELGARTQVRKRDVSLHTMTEEGTKANDTFSTIVQTAKKLGVSAYAYFNDRISKSFKMPALAELIESKKSSALSCKDTVSYTHLRAHETRHDLVC